MIQQLEAEAAGLKEMLRIKKLEKERIIQKNRRLEQERQRFLQKNRQDEIGDEDLLEQLENQREELRSLKLTYNQLREETDKQRRDLKSLSEQDDEFMAVPTSQSELVEQNKKLEDKLESMKRDFEKVLYEKTLEIEKQARAKMQKHAIKAALQYVDRNDPEVAQLVNKLKILEKENEKLEGLGGDGQNRSSYR